MKKITFLLTLVLTLLCSTTAQAYDWTPGSRATSLTADRYYAIYNTCATGGYGKFFLYDNGEGLGVTHAATPAAFSSLEAKHVWQLKSSGTDGVYYLLNVATGKYVNVEGATNKDSGQPLYITAGSSYTGATGGEVMTETGGAGAFADAGIFLITGDYTSSSYYRWTSENGAFKANTGWGAQAHAFYEVSSVVVSELLSVETTVNSWVWKDVNGNEVAASDASFTSVTVKSDVVTDVVKTALGISCLDENYFNVSISAEGVVTIQETSNIPFAISSGDSESWVWQKMNSRGEYMGYDATDDKIFKVANEIKSSNLWAFVRDDKPVSFKIYNLAVGTATPMGLTSTGGMSSPVTFPAEAVVDAFNVCANSNHEGGFAISYDGLPLTYFLNDRLVYNHWNSDLATSADHCTFVEDIDDLIADVDLVIKENCVGSAAGTADQIKAYEDAKTAYSAAGGATTTNLKALVEAFDNISTITLSTDKYYRLYLTGWAGATCNQDGWSPNTQSDITYKYLSAQTATAASDGTISASNNLGVTRSDGAALMNDIWFFDGNTGVEGQYYIKNVNTNLAIGSEQSQYYVQMSTGTGSKFRLDAGKDNVSYKLYSSDKSNYIKSFKKDQQMNPPLGASYKNYLLSFGNDNAHEWYIEEAKSVTVNVGSDIGYASVCFPFAVKIPAGAKAVVASAYSNDEITLADAWMEGEIMPANSPVLIEYAAGGDLVFEIQLKSEAGKPYSGTNLFKGTTARREGFTVKSLYALTANESNEAAMWCVDLTAFPANKAYILSTDLQDATGAVLKFNAGSLTGVDAIGNGKLTIDNAPVYDLSGRVVAKPTKGGVYIKGGKKYIVK